MSKERVDRFVAGVAAGLIQFPNHWLPPDQREPFREFVYRIVAGQKVSPEELHVLDNYELVIGGLENLEKLRGRSALVLINHPFEGPLRIIGPALLFYQLVKRTTGQEPILLMGKGLSIVTALREKIAATTDAVVLVGDEKGQSKEVMLSLLAEGKMVLLAPEGKNSNQLRRGDFRAGRLSFHAVAAGYPLICMVEWFKDNKHHINISPVLNEEQAEVVKRLGTLSPNPKEAGQETIDYLMGMIMADLPPENRRGYYKVKIGPPSKIAA